MTGLLVGAAAFICGVFCCLLIGVWRLNRDIVTGLRAENKELRDRLYQKNALPPSGIDLTEKYEERQERIQARMESPNQGRRPAGPIEKLTAKWTEQDRVLVERNNIDATRGRVN